jgi:hypothetical protein
MLLATVSVIILVVLAPRPRGGRCCVAVPVTLAPTLLINYSTATSTA